MERFILSLCGPTKTILPVVYEFVLFFVYMSYLKKKEDQKLLNLKFKPSLKCEESIRFWQKLGYCKRDIT